MKKANIIACFGNVNAKSTAKLCNSTLSYVQNIWSEAELYVRKK